MRVLGGFAALALLLAAVGLYGVVSYTVAQRTREVGVRMALGARPADILRLVFRSGATTVAAGLAVGVAAALAALQSMRALLFDVSVSDPATLAGAVGGALGGRNRRARRARAACAARRSGHRAASGVELAVRSQATGGIRQPDCDGFEPIIPCGRPEGRRYTPRPRSRFRRPVMRRTYREPFRPRRSCQRAAMRTIETILQDMRYGARTLLRAPGFTAAALRDAGARHRRQHRHLQRRQRGAVAAAAVSGARADRAAGSPQCRWATIRARPGCAICSSATTCGRSMPWRPGAARPASTWRPASRRSTSRRCRSRRSSSTVFGVRLVHRRAVPRRARSESAGRMPSSSATDSGRGLFGANPAVVGTTVTLGDRAHTVLGVMPRGFVSVPPADVYVPLRPSTTGPGRRLQLRGRRPPEARRERRAGECARPPRCGRRFAARIPPRSGRRVHRRASCRTKAPVARVRAAGAAPDARRGRHAAADGVREHRQPAPGPRRRPRARDCACGPRSAPAARASSVSC